VLFGYIKKIRKNGFVRLFKSNIEYFTDKLRAYPFSLLGAKPAFPKKLKIGKGTKTTVKTLKIGSDVSIGIGCSFAGLGKIEINSGVRINRNSHFDCSHSIIIGVNTFIAPDCYIVDSNHVMPESGSLISENTIVKHVIIGSNVWLGRGVTILPGVEIGNNTIIGAGAVVTKSIPAWTVAYGVPAKVSRK